MKMVTICFSSEAAAVSKAALSPTTAAACMALNASPAATLVGLQGGEEEGGREA
jgi:hypothetical protein